MTMTCWDHREYETLTFSLRAVHIHITHLMGFVFFMYVCRFKYAAFLPETIGAPSFQGCCANHPKCASASISIFIVLYKATTCTTVMRGPWFLHLSFIFRMIGSAILSIGTVT